MSLHLLGTFTVDTGTDEIIFSGHNRYDNSKVQISSSGTPPGGLASATTYYCIVTSASRFKVSLTAGGSAIDITDAGTGTHQLYVEVSGAVKSIDTQDNPQTGSDAKGSEWVSAGVAQLALISLDSPDSIQSLVWFLSTAKLAIITYDAKDAIQSLPWLNVATDKQPLTLGQTQTDDVVIDANNPATFTSETQFSISNLNIEGIASCIVTYSGLVIGGIYCWTKGANESSFASGSVFLMESGCFVADSTMAVVTGPGALMYTGQLIRVDSPFVPEKFVVYQGQVYVRATTGKIYLYGGVDNNTFDRIKATVELPWLDMKTPSTRKQGLGLDAAFSGLWEVFARMDPKATNLIRVWQRGDPVSPSMVEDSTFDVGHFPFSDNGTHVKVKFVSGIAAEQAKLGKAIVLYKLANKK